MIEYCLFYIIFNVRTNYFLKNNFINTIYLLIMFLIMFNGMDGLNKAIPVFQCLA